MNLVDILIWVVLLIFAVKGFMKGLVKEVCSLLGLVVGGWVACAYYGHIAGAIGPHVHLPRFIVTVLSFGLIFVALALSFYFLGQLLTTFFKIIFLGTVNRLAGLFLGVLEGVFVLGILLGLAVSEPAPVKLRQQVVKTSSAAPFLVLGREMLSWWKKPEADQRKKLPAGTSRTTGEGRNGRHDFASRWAAGHDS